MKTDKNLGRTDSEQGHVDAAQKPEWKKPTLSSLDVSETEGGYAVTGFELAPYSQS